VSDPWLANWRFLLGFWVLVGASVGSFLNVVAWRVPAGRSVVSPPSACPSCRSPIEARDNVPLLSWLLLRGRCRVCREPISPRYPAVEALCALLWGAVFWRVVPGPQSLERPELLGLAAAWGLFFSALLAASLVDAEHFILPDPILLPLIPLGVAVSAWSDVAGLARAAGGVALPQSVFGAVVGAGAMVALAWAGRAAFGREALGGGDARLLAAIGAWQGLHPALILTVFGGSLLGSVVGLTQMSLHGRKRGAKLPFGPYLCAGAFLAWIGGDGLWRALTSGAGVSG
jgi:leader peptidase (prepilin peptidase)/N-methyltransferase